MRRIILMLGLAWSLSFPATAHQCVLEGSTSEAIQSYNACKLDLATGHEVNATQICGIAGGLRIRRPTEWVNANVAGFC